MFSGSFSIIQPVQLNGSVAAAFLAALLFRAFVGVMMTLTADCPPSNFSDVASRVILSDIVIEGTLTESASEAAIGLDSRVWRADIAVDVVFKGGPFGVNAGKVSVLLTDEMLSCTGTMQVDRRYIVFLRGDRVTSFSGRDFFFYWASGPPTVSTAKRIRVVKKHSCKTCAQYPKVEISSETVFWKVGDSIELKCRLFGLPIPRVTWFRNGEIVKTSKRIVIISRRAESTLTMSGAVEGDGGVYSCAAENVLGSATSLRQPIGVESDWMMIPRDEPPPHSKLCDDQTYCLNDGVCYILQDTDAKFCVCSAGFTGPRCQDKEFEVRIGGMDNVPVIICIFLLLLLLITAFAILYCIARFRRDFSEYERRYLSTGRGRESEDNQLRPETSDILESHEKLFSSNELRNSRDERREHAFDNVESSSVTSKVLPLSPATNEDSAAGATLQRTKTTALPRLSTKENSGFSNVNSGELSDLGQGDDGQGQPSAEVRHVTQEVVESATKSGEAGRRAEAAERTSRRPFSAIDVETPLSTIPSPAAATEGQQRGGQSSCTDDGEQLRKGDVVVVEGRVEDGTKTSSSIADDTASPPEEDKSTSGQTMF